MKKIAVIGSINMDLVLGCDRMPGKGETILGHTLDFNPGGKGANQAVAAAKVGGDVTMFGCVGEDDMGKKLLENLQEQGVHTEFVSKIADCPSGQAFITVAEGDNSIVVISGANACVTKSYIDSVREHILDCDIIVLQNEIPAETIHYVIDFCYEAGKRIIYNPAPAADASQEMLEKVTFLTPNRHEVLRLFPEKELDALFEEKREQLIVTLGESGVRTGDLLIPAYRVEVADTTGAGDTLNGVFAAALSFDKNTEEALRFANAASALSITKPGAQGGMPTYAEVAAFMDQKRI